MDQPPKSSNLRTYGAIAGVILGGTILSIVVAAQGEVASAERALSAYQAAEASRSPEQRRREHELQRSYDLALFECAAQARARYGAQGYDRQRDCGHIPEGPLSDRPLPPRVPSLWEAVRD
ncbi:hypothetical protein D3C78_1481770 [compost metagenome]